MDFILAALVVVAFAFLMSWDGRRQSRKKQQQEARRVLAYKLGYYAAYNEVTGKDPDLTSLVVVIDLESSIDLEVEELLK